MPYVFKYGNNDLIDVDTYSSDTEGYICLTIFLHASKWSKENENSKR